MSGQGKAAQASYSAGGLVFWQAGSAPRRQRIARFLAGWCLCFAGLPAECAFQPIPEETHHERRAPAYARFHRADKSRAVFAPRFMTASAAVTAGIRWQRTVRADVIKTDTDASRLAIQK